MEWCVSSHGVIMDKICHSSSIHLPLWSGYKEGVVIAEDASCIILGRKNCPLSESLEPTSGSVQKIKPQLRADYSACAR